MQIVLRWVFVSREVIVVPSADLRPSLRVVKKRAPCVVRFKKATNGIFLIDGSLFEFSKGQSSLDFILLSKFLDTKLHQRFGAF